MHPFLRSFACTFLALALAACGGGSELDGAGAGAGGDAVPPGSNGRPAEAAALPPGAPTAPVPIIEQPEGAEEKRVLALVAEEHVGELYRLVGRYASGAAGIYRGSFAARDNLGSIGTWYKDGVMTGDSVTASLAWEPKLVFDGKSEAGWALVASTGTQRMLLAQRTSSPGRTAFSLVTPENSSYGVTGSCTGCVAPFTATSPAITVSNAVASGKFGTGQPLRITASAGLARVPTSSVVFADLVAVADPYVAHRVIEELVLEGTERVRTVSSKLSENVPVPAGTDFQSCSRNTSYRLDWFVDDHVLTRYGLRNMKIDGTQTCCSKAKPGGCTMQTTCF